MWVIKSLILTVLILSFARPVDARPIRTIPSIILGAAAVCSAVLAGVAVKENQADVAFVLLSGTSVLGSAAYMIRRKPVRNYAIPLPLHLRPDSVKIKQ
jgi:hypothetical protein